MNRLALPWDPSRRPLDPSPLLTPTLMLFTLVLSAGCAGPAPRPGPAPIEASRPAWIEQFPEDPDYPPQRFFGELGSHDLDSGETEARRQAAQQARSAIARSIRTQITSTLESYQRNLSRKSARGEQIVDFVSIEEHIVAETEAELTGTRVAHSWRDDANKIYWLKIVLDREGATERLVTKIDRHVAELPEVPAPQSASTGEQIIRLLEIHAGIVDALATVATAEIIAPPSSPATRKLATRRTALFELLDTVIDSVEQLNATIFFEVIAGGGQQVQPDGTLASPVSVQIRDGWGPLADFPVRFQLDAGKGVLAAETATGSDGIVNCMVAGLMAQPDRNGRLLFPRGLVARLNYASVSPELPEHLAPSRSIPMTWPTLGGSRVGIAIVETRHDEPVDSSSVSAAMVQMLRDWGARTQPLPATEVTAAAAGDLADAVAIAQAANYDYLLRGHATAEARPFQRAHFSYAGGRLELIDVKRGVLIGVVNIDLDGSARGADVNESKRAGDRALAELATELRKRWSEQLSNRFAPPR